MMLAFAPEYYGMTSGMTKKIRSYPPNPPNPFSHRITTITSITTFRNRKDIGNNKFKLKFLLFVTLRVIKVDAKSLDSRSMAAKKGQVVHYCIIREFDSRLPFIARKRLIFNTIWELCNWLTYVHFHQVKPA
jgi:hypothetical protein